MEMQVAVVVELAEVAGAEPVTGEGFCGLLGEVVVAGEHGRPTHQDLAVLVAADLHPGQRAPGGVETRVAGRIQGQQRGGLGQAITGRDVEAEGFEAPCQHRIECGAARGEQAQAATQAPAQRHQQAARHPPAEMPAQCGQRGQ